MTAPVLYVRDGSRFVPVDDARPAPWLVDVPPIPVPVPVLDEDPMAPTAARPVVEVRPGYYRLYAPRCPHGHFARWARGTEPKTGSPNCKPCHRPEARRAR